MTQILKGKFVNLELLNESHREELRLIAEDSSIWEFYPYSMIGDLFDIEFDKALHKLDSDEEMPFVIRSNNNAKLIGSSRFYDINRKYKRLAIGHTWYIEEARGTVVNPECKLRLLTYAFEDLHMNRVEFITDSRNL